MLEQRFVLGVACLGFLASAHAANTTMRELDYQISQGCNESVVWNLQYAQQSNDPAIAEKAAQAERACDPQKAKEYAAKQKAEREGRARQAEQEAAEQKRLSQAIVAWRKTIKVGDDSFCGPVIEVRRPMYKIAVRTPQVQPDKAVTAKAFNELGRNSWLQDKLDAERGWGPKERPPTAAENSASGEKQRTDAPHYLAENGSEAWLKESEIFPPIFGCSNVNGRLSPTR